MEQQVKSTTCVGFALFDDVCTRVTLLPAPLVIFWCAARRGRRVRRRVGGGAEPGVDAAAVVVDTFTCLSDANG